MLPPRQLPTLLLAVPQHHLELPTGSSPLAPSNHPSNIPWNAAVLKVAALIRCNWLMSLVNCCWVEPRLLARPRELGRSRPVGDPKGPWGGRRSSRLGTSRFWWVRCRRKYLADQDRPVMAVSTLVPPIDRRQRAVVEIAAEESKVGALRPVENSKGGDQDSSVECRVGAQNLGVDQGRVGGDQSQTVFADEGLALVLVLDTLPEFRFDEVFL
ncbi:BQ5605_C120g13290 [Microbotryum silenes-dioicae]|uniref:BQ5605_C120g13290 protein n=1 Tax=Microbotryum silenes-dioicae TaxID=796604 RepID=A0A2X0NUY9_9BASI|nr:BQ5605_C120g13290 [Microbotryum silenes-dioicae]